MPTNSASSAALSLRLYRQGLNISKKPPALDRLACILLCVMVHDAVCQNISSLAERVRLHRGIGTDPPSLNVMVLYLLVMNGLCAGVHQIMPPL